MEVNLGGALCKPLQLLFRKVWCRTHAHTQTHTPPPKCATGSEKAGVMPLSLLDLPQHGARYEFNVH